MIYPWAMSQVGGEDVATSLVIVESPAKARTIKKFLGSRYTVKATMGHLKDLPRSQFGVDVDNDYQPKYITIRGKGSILQELKKAAKKSDRVFLATDPDREGEAIAWHVAQELNLDGEKCRIEFREITKNAVTNAIKNHGIYLTIWWRHSRDGGSWTGSSATNFRRFCGLKSGRV